jgi:hypothetical protein
VLARGASTVHAKATERHGRPSLLSVPSSWHLKNIDQIAVRVKQRRRIAVVIPNRPCRIPVKNTLPATHRVSTFAAQQQRGVSRVELAPRKNISPATRILDGKALQLDQMSAHIANANVFSVEITSVITLRVCLDCGDLERTRLSVCLPHAFALRLGVLLQLQPIVIVLERANHEEMTPPFGDQLRVDKGIPHVDVGERAAIDVPLSSDGFQTNSLTQHETFVIPCRFLIEGLPLLRRIHPAVANHCAVGQLDRIPIENRSNRRGERKRREADKTQKDKGRKEEENDQAKSAWEVVR